MNIHINHIEPDKTYKMLLIESNGKLLQKITQFLENEYKIRINNELEVGQIMEINGNKVNIAEFRITEADKQKHAKSQINHTSSFITKNEAINFISRDEMILQKMINCVNLHLGDAEFDLSRMIIEIGMSRSTLFRKLKALTGLSFCSFVRTLRIKAACKIIEEKKHLNISELAYAVGFNDPKYFSQCFKKEIGMYPSKYLRQSFLTKKTVNEQLS